MIILETSHGTGDTYMTLAFATALRAARGKQVVVRIPEAHRAIAAMFPDVAIDDGSPRPGAEVIVAHPSAPHPHVRIDHLCLLARPLTHADLWRAMLGLQPGEPMRRGRHFHRETTPRTALLIREARSIPNSAPEFWMILEHKLMETGWQVEEGSHHATLGELFEACARAEWVVGPQCGVMSILCHAQFPCRKTFATPSLDGHPYFKRTYPYMRTYTFAGETYADVDEVKIERDVGRAIDRVLSGPCAVLSEVPRGPAASVSAPTSFGDLLDRASILEIKYERLPIEKRAAIHREYLWHAETVEHLLRDDKDLIALYDTLKRINEHAWDQNDVAVRAVMRGGSAEGHYDGAVRLNKDRIRIKGAVDEHCKSQFREAKSYYD